jgi:DNA-binding NarL/FixJ family response regulator
MPSSTPLIIIIIAASNASMRDALRLLLEAEIDGSIIETAADAEALLVLVQQTSPALLLIDWRLPGMRPIRLLNTIYTLHPRVKVIILSERSDDRSRARHAGANGFALKTEPPDRLLSLVRMMLTNVMLSD